MCVHEGGHGQLTFTGLVVLLEHLVDQSLTFWTWATIRTINTRDTILTIFTRVTYRHVRWKGGESTTCILLECWEVKEERKWSTWASCLPFRPGLPSVPSSPGTPMEHRWKDVESITWIVIECLEEHEERLCVYVYKH